MARRRKKAEKNGKPTQLQIAGVFLFFLILRFLLLFFRENMGSRYTDIMTVFVAFAGLRLKLSGPSLLAWSWIAGISEDMFSGCALGSNALSKLTVAEALSITSRKVEIGNAVVQILLAMVAFALDVLVKYGVAYATLETSLAKQVLASILMIKVATGTILYLITCAIMR